MTLQFLRKLLFYVFTALYLVLCPAAILYALGYILVPQSHELVQTGTLYVSTIPDNADIYLNTSRYTLTTSTAIQGLLPGDYRVTLARAGYRSWSRLVSVAAGDAVRLANVLLLPDPLRRHTIAEGPFRDLIGLSESDILVASEDQLGSYRLLSAGSTNLTPLVGSASPFNNVDVREVFTIASSKQVILRVRQQRLTRYLVVNTATPKTPPRDIAPRIQGTPRSLLWDPDEPNQILAVYDTYADRIDVEDDVLYPHFVADGHGIGLRKGEMYILTSDNRLLRQDLTDGDDTELLMGDSAFGDTIFDSAEHYRVLPLSHDRIIFLDDDGALITNISPFRFVDKGVRGVAYLASGDQVLVWTDRRIGILSFTRDETQRGVFKALASLRWIYSQGRDISRCFWALKGAYVVFSDRHAVYVLRVTDSDSEPTERVLDVEDGAAVHYVSRTATLYCLEEGTVRLCAVPLLSRSATSFTFAERPDAVETMETTSP